MNKKDKLIGIVGYLEEECEDCQVKLAALRKEISCIESKLVGNKEKLLQARESLRKHVESLPNREVTLRESEIASMFGYQLKVGNQLDERMWQWVCSHRSC